MHPQPKVAIILFCYTTVVVSFLDECIEKRWKKDLWIHISSVYWSWSLTNKLLISRWMTSELFIVIKKIFYKKKTIAITQEKNFWKPTKNLQKNRQKPIKTDKNRFYFSGPWPDRQIPTVKRVCRFTSQIWESCSHHVIPFLVEEDNRKARKFLRFESPN